jgi:hypothetical protein
MLPAWVCKDCDTTEIPAEAVQWCERRAAAVVLREGGEPTGAVLRYARKALDLRQTDLAALLGCASETVSRWEHDKEPASRAVRGALVGFLEGAAMGVLDLAQALAEARGTGVNAPAELEVRPLREAC